MACYNQYRRNNATTNPGSSPAPAGYPAYAQPVAPVDYSYNMEPSGRADNGNIGVSGAALAADNAAWPVQPPPLADDGNQIVSSTGPMFTPESEMPETLTEYIYTPGYLRSQIGRLMRVEFLVANNTTDRVGVLEEVGASYIVLGSLETGSKIMCDLYSIKFVTIIENQLGEALDAGF